MVATFVVIDSVADMDVGRVKVFVAATIAHVNKNGRLEQEGAISTD